MNDKIQDNNEITQSMNTYLLTPEIPLPSNNPASEQHRVTQASAVTLQW